MSIQQNILKSNQIVLTSPISGISQSLTLLDLQSSHQMLQDGFLKQSNSNKIKGYIIEAEFPIEELTSTSDTTESIKFIKSIKDSDEIYVNEYLGTAINNKLIFNDELNQNSIIIKIYIKLQ